MAVILTYDVARAHTLVKDTLLSYGYTDAVAAVNTAGKSGNIALPNTTLYHASRKAIGAYQDLERATALHGVTIEKGVAFELASPVEYWGWMKF